MKTMENDALSLEYKRDYGTASGYLDIADLVNNPAFGGKCRVLGLGFEKESFNLLLGQLRPFFNDRPDSFLIGAHAGEPLH